MIIVGMYLVKNVFLTLLCLMSVMWKICLKNLLKSLFGSIVRFGTKTIEFFRSLLKLCFVKRLVYLRFLKGKVLDVDFKSHSM